MNERDERNQIMMMSIHTKSDSIIMIKMPSLAIDPTN